MKIAQLTPGSGDNFYCENCRRDMVLIRAMRDLGHDVLMVPMYLPLREVSVEDKGNLPIFFGGINAYLQQKSGIFRKTPRWIDRWLDSPRLLSWAGRRANMTNAKDLGEITISMLRGEQGRQVKELDRLIEWLGREENMPDVVCLSNVLLVGFAREIKAKLNVPVVCLLQDEDGFLDSLGDPYSQQAWQIVSERSADVDAFVSVSRYYAGVMRERLGLGRDIIRVVHAGVTLEGYDLQQDMSGGPVIGYLSRLCHDKGLDTLVDTFISLKGKPNLENARLRISGGQSDTDTDFIAGLRDKLSSCGLSGDVEFMSDFSDDSRKAFFNGLSVLSVPERYPPACGLYVLESLAASVPVVQPAFGVFPELVEMTGGGLLYEPGNAIAHAEAVEKMLTSADYGARLGRAGRNAVAQKLCIEHAASKTVAIYDELIRG